MENEVEKNRKITLLIPAHNEEDRIGETIEYYINYFKDIEILIEMDGCEDKTLEIVKEYSKIKKNNNKISYLHFNSRLGKGAGLLKAFERADGEILVITDADGSTPPSELLKLINGLDGNACTIGSRWMSDSIVPIKQSLRRRIASRIFNYLVRILFDLPFKDTQCGAKVLKKSALVEIIRDMSTFNFAFDIDLLYQLHKKGLKVREIPITWNNKEGSSVKIFNTSITMLLAVIRLKIMNSYFKPLIDNNFTGYIYDYLWGKR